MAWTTFPTLTDGQIWTGAHTQIIRDNFAETAPAKATATGKLIVTTGANTIAQRTVQTTSVNAAQSTATTSYTNLTTVGPVVGPLTTGSFAVAWASAQCSQNTNGVFAKFGVTVSGASAITATDAQAFYYQPSTAASSGVRGTVCVAYEGTLTPGLNQFTQQYCASAGTASFDLRTLTVFAL